MELTDTSDARKEKIDREKAWHLISGVKTIFIGKGKKVLKFKPEPGSKAEILKASMGRSGNLRAPAIKTRDTMYIGFNDEIYSSL